MIDSIDISEFRGIQELNEPIFLSEFTILLGRNNTGKSAILEALYLLFGGRDPVISQNRTSRVRNLHSGAQNLIYRYTGEANLNYFGDNTEGTTQVDSSNNLYIEIGGHSLSNNANPSMLADLGFEDAHQNTISYLFSSAYEDQRQYLNQLHQSKRAEIEKIGAHVEVAEFINENIGDEYTEIYLENMEMRKHPEDERQFFVDVDDLGNGIVRVLPIFLSIETIKPKFVLWDDIETALHPSLLRQVLNWLIEKDIQIIASTHSIDVLSAVLEIEPKDTSIIQLSKSEDDIVTHNRLNLEDLSNIMDNAGLDPRVLSDEFSL